MAETEQKINDLYRVNSIASWAKGNLKILGDMLEDKECDRAWLLGEIRRIEQGVESVASLEDARKS